MKQTLVRFVLNGDNVKMSVGVGMPLLTFLRDVLGHTEVKEGCGQGDCGACAVLVDGVPVNACLLLAVQVNGCSVVTVKGLSTNGKPHHLQKSFSDLGAVQCGFCTPGMIISAKACLDRTPRPTRKEIRRALSGNLCRCTGYTQIVDAVEEASRALDTRG